MAPLSNKKKKEISLEMSKAREGLDASLVNNPDEFIGALEKIALTMNEKIEDRLEDFKSDSIRLFKDYHQARPNCVLTLAQKEQVKIREAVDSLVELFEPIVIDGYRSLAADVLRDCMYILVQSFNDRQTVILKHGIGSNLQ